MQYNYEIFKKETNNKLEDETRELLSYFSILWNLFEGRVFFQSFKFKIVDDMIDESVVIIIGNKIEHLYNRLTLFTQKYNGDFSTESFKDFYCVRDSDISSIQLNELFSNLNTFNKLKILLLAVSRVRNNMFHGLKEISKLNEQKELFLICNELLIALLDAMNLLYL